MVDVEKEIVCENSVSISDKVLKYDGFGSDSSVEDQSKILLQNFSDIQGSVHDYSCSDSPVSFTESTSSAELKGNKKKVSSNLKITKVKKRKKDDIYEVEYILDYVECKNDAFYLVKWKNWESQYNSWEPKENVLNCQEILDDFFSSVYGSCVHSRKDIDAYAESFSKPSKELLERLMTSLVKDGKVEYEVPSLRKVCMALSALLSVSEDERNLDSMLTVNNDIALRCFHVKRLQQLKSLKEWEDEINASSYNSAHINVENIVDLEGPPDNFYYVNNFIPGIGVTIPDEPPIGCSCRNCEPSTCSCAKESHGQFAYNPDGTVRTSSRVPIYECNKLCSCSKSCINRVVQRGCQVKLSIFRTNTGCGWGVKALESISKGTFVSEYVGEVINSEEAEERGMKYDAVGQTYLFDLDFNDKEHCPYTVDAAFLGNISHFFNHSCCPNLTVYAVWVNCLDPDLPKLAFFARRQIEENEELTFDYRAQTVLPRADSLKISCKCKSTKCRKYLF